jgi:geranylgeranyl diphosphate synthase type I
MDFLHRFEQAREAWLPSILALAEECIQGSVPGDSSLPGMARYHMKTVGKRLRALLPLLTAQALGRDPRGLVPFGAACEVLHNATLVHDDLQDGDRLRRGEPTVWAHYGQPQAINLGDAMFYWTLLLVQRLDAPPALREAVSRRVLLETLRVIDGQEQEFALKTRPASLEGYFAMVEGKTSGLFALPMAGAALFCEAPTQVVEDLAEAARHMGVLFQIQDDVLDLFGSKGRDMVGTDIAEGKRSALVVHAMTTLPSECAGWLEELLDTPREQTRPEDIEEAIEILRARGSLDFALAELERRRAAALAVPSVAENPSLRDLVGGMCSVFLAPIQPLLEERGA